MLSYFTGPQAPKPNHTDESNFENTQMRSLGSSYPSANYGNPPPRNGPRTPYGEPPKPRTPYGEPPKPRDSYSPTGRPSYGGDMVKPKPSSSYYPPPSKFQNRPAPGSSRYPDRPQGYPNRGLGGPPQRSSSYRPGPSSGAESKAPPRTRSDIRGPYGPGDLY